MTPVNDAENSQESAIPLHRVESPLPEGILPFAIERFERMGPLAQAPFPHRHNFYEVLLVTDGEGCHFIDFEAYPIQPPLFYFVAPGQVHYWETTRAVRGRAVMFTEEFLLFGMESAKRNINILNEFPFFHAGAGPPLLWLERESLEPFNALLQDIQDEYQAAASGWAMVLSAYLHILLIKLQRLYSRQQTAGQVSRASQLVCQFKRLVAEHFINERSVHFYAGRLGVSASHLADTVKALTGVSPGVIIRQTVALEAKRLLIHSDWTAEQISYHLQFEDPSYFGRFFRRETGLSPGIFSQAFREKYQILRTPSLP